MQPMLYRTEPGRYAVNAKCRGEGVALHSGLAIRYKGIDVSRRGFGCVITGEVETGHHVRIQIGGRQITLQIMWCESHLGIENMHRVGMTPLDPEVNIESIVRDCDLMEVSLPNAS